jgi:prepilin-type N-terminal cleavage/methylation domain-containing protein
MRTSLSHRHSGRGFTLIECLVYMSVLAVILGVGSAAFYRCWDDNKAITRNGNDIVRTLKAGEAWRAEMRHATGPIRIVNTGSEQTVRIPSGKQNLVYSFANGEVRKQIGESGAWKVVLPNVKSSMMQSDQRAQVFAWRWEVELQSQRKNVKFHPLFTFEAVPEKSFNQ